MAPKSNLQFKNAHTNWRGILTCTVKRIIMLIITYYTHYKARLQNPRLYSQCNTTTCCEASNPLKHYYHDKVKENSASESAETDRPA